MKQKTLHINSMRCFYLKKVASIVLVIIGTLIGAGFASGKEIDLFFFEYQKNGIYGLIVSSIILSCIIYMVFNLIKKEKINTYEGFLKQISGFGKRSNNILYYSIKLMIDIFLLISFYIMIAGFGAYFEQELGISKLIGIAFISILCYFTFQKRTNAIIKVNSILVPILILFILYLGFKNPYNYSNVIFKTIGVKTHWLISAIIYSSYNSIILIPILITLKSKKINNIGMFVTSIICGIILFILGQSIYFLLFNISNVQNIEIPTIAVAAKLHPAYQYIFGIIVLISIFTSCISCGYAFLERYEGKKYQKINKIICFLSIIVSQIGFSNLVNILYPIFGYLGLVQIIKLSV